MKPVDPADSEALRALLEIEHFSPILAHAPYTLNPCAEKENVREFDRYEYKPFNGDLVRLYMYMRCYLYQCSEEPVYDTLIYRAVRELSRDLAGAIVLRLADEKGAKWT